MPGHGSVGVMTTSESPPLKRWLRRAGIGGTTILIAVVALVALLQLPPVATAVVRKLLTLAPLNPGNRLEVGRVSGNFFGDLTLEDLRLRQAGRELAFVRRVHLGYRLPRIRPPVSRFDEIDVREARVTTRRQGGQWDLQQVLRQSSDTTGGGGFSIGRLRVRHASVSAALSPDSVVGLNVVEFAAHDLAVGDTARVAIDELDLAVRPPASPRWFSLETRGGVTADEIRLDPFRMHTETSTLSGRVVLPRRLDDARQVDRLDVRLTARPLDLADLAAVMPSVSPAGALELDTRAGAKGGLVTAHLAASLDRAKLTLDGGTQLRDGKPTSYRLHGVVSALDPSKLIASAPAGIINGRVDAELDGPLSTADGGARLQVGDSRVGTASVHRFELGAAFTRGTADFTLLGALDTGVVRVTGRARPFDAIPSYRLAGSARRMPGTAAVARALAGSDGDPVLVIRFRLTGQGKSADSARARGRVELTAARDGRADSSVGHADLRLAEGTLDVRPVLLTSGGRISAVGRVTLGDTMTYELRQGRIDGVDIRRITDDTTGVPLSGRFSLSGRGTAPALAQVTARVHLDEVRSGLRRAGDVDILARLDAGSLRLDGQGALQGGRLVVEATGRPFDSSAAYVLRRGALERVDLGELLGRPDLAGPVTLRAEGMGRVRGGERALYARLNLEPSRLGHLEVSGGEGSVRLAGERLTYEAAVRGNGGALSLAGDGAPTAAAPAYRIREGRITAMNLGAILGRPDVRTDLNLTFTGNVTRLAPDSLVAALDLALLPSRVNQAQLTGGSLAARMSGGRLEGKLKVEGRDAVLASDVTAQSAEGEHSVTVRGDIRIEHLARWTNRHDADGRLESRFAIEARADSAGFRSAAGTVDALGGVGGVRLQGLRLVLSPAEGQLQVDTLRVRSNVAAIDGRGRLALRPGAAPGKLSLTAALGDLGPVAALAGADTVAFDSARVHWSQPVPRSSGASTVVRTRTVWPRAATWPTGSRSRAGRRWTAAA